MLNKHRTVIYRKRRELLELASQPTHDGERPLKPRVLEAIEGEVEQLVAFHTASENPVDWEEEKIAHAVKALLPENMELKEKIAFSQAELEGREDLATRRSALIQIIMKLVQEAYQTVEQSIGDEALMAEIEKAVLLRAMDDLWIEHLEAIDHLRHSIGLQGYGQRDPLVEYKKEAYRLFNQLNASVNERVAHTVLKVQVARQTAEQERQNQSAFAKPMQFSAPAKEAQEAAPVAKSAPGKAMPKVGRNDSCPCGSGKKYKQCHGK